VEGVLDGVDINTLKKHCLRRLLYRNAENEIRLPDSS
jgi:hypothetical protein